MSELNIFHKCMRVLQWLFERKQSTRTYGWFCYSKTCEVVLHSTGCPAMLSDCTFSTHSSKKWLMNFTLLTEFGTDIPTFQQVAVNICSINVPYIFCENFLLDGLLCTHVQLRLLAYGRGGGFWQVTCELQPYRCEKSTVTLTLVVVDTVCATIELLLVVLKACSKLVHATILTV